ncbi:MAG: hypothetical protein WC532_04230 [Candidatus Omnitrophota bacterium]
MKIGLGQPSRAFPVFIYSAIIFYFFICTLHLILRRPPWLDEIFLINNLKELSPAGIFGPLKYSQGFPRLYLFIIQNLSRAFNYGVISLRALPFVFMITGFGLWLAAFRKQYGRGDAYLLFILCWCGSWFMTYYAAEFKQYSADVFAAGAFTYFILKQKESVLSGALRPRLFLQYLFLPVLLLFSYAAYFFIIIPAYNLLLSSLRQRRSLFYLAAYLLSIAAFSFLSYNYDLKYTLAAPALHGYWESYFISTASPAAFMETFWEGLRNIFVRWFEQGPPVTWIMTIFMPFALYYAFRYGIKQFRADKYLCVSLDSLTIVLLAGLFFTGLLRAFPFTAGRVTLFIAPFIFCAIIKGAEIFKAKFWAGYAVLTAGFVFTLLSVSMRLVSRYMPLY